MYQHATWRSVEMVRVEVGVVLPGQGWVCYTCIYVLVLYQLSIFGLNYRVQVFHLGLNENY